VRYIAILLKNPKFYIEYIAYIVLYNIFRDGIMGGKKFYLKTIVFILSASIMIGHGARMIYQGLFKPDSYYPAPTPYALDFWFDWTVLLVLGIIVFTFAISSFYKNLNKKGKKKKYFSIQAKNLMIQNNDL